jgi:hypothetical protein
LVKTKISFTLRGNRASEVLALGVSALT